MILFAVIDIIEIFLISMSSGYIQSEKFFIVSGIIMIAFLFVGKKLNLIGMAIFRTTRTYHLFLGLEMVLGVNLFKDDEPNGLYRSASFSYDCWCGTNFYFEGRISLINIIIAIVINIISHIIPNPPARLKDYLNVLAPMTSRWGGFISHRS